jgi:hypothetical protein
MIYHVFIDYLDQENGFVTKFSYSYVALMLLLLLMILRQQVGYKNHMYMIRFIIIIDCVPVLSVA